MSDREPSYVSLHRAGGLEARVEAAWGRLASCDLCARRCGARRLAGELGYCHAPLEVVVSSAGPHFGEEPPLVGRGGSGTLFLAWCPLGCVFCQNAEISHGGVGSGVTPAGLAAMMIELQRLGCHNINFVTPSHYLPHILRALPAAAEAGLGIPLVWNCGGYENPEALRLLDGIVDIYMPDFKFVDAQAAGRYCAAPDYPDAARASLREMHRQVGDLRISDGLARRGLLARHLVMPGLGENTRGVLEFLAREISTETYVNIMDQYRPAHEAAGYPELARRISREEYARALSQARLFGLHRGFGGEE